MNVVTSPRTAASMIDSFHSLLMDDDQFNEAMQRVALKVAEDHLEALRLNDPQSGAYDEETLYDLAMALCCRVTVA